MKRVKFLLLSLVAGSLWFLSSCGGGDEPEPQPTSVKFTVTSATFDQVAIDPLPSYTLTFKFDAEGNPNGYEATGSTNLTPTTADSGTFTVAANVITFSAGAASRSVSGNVNASSKSLTLDYTLTKIEDGVSAEDQGDYRYEMAAQ